MHSFTELVDRSTSFTLNNLKEASDRVVDALQTSAATHLIKSLEMIQLQKAIMAVGMFSIFESMLQDKMANEDGFAVARRCLDDAGEFELRKRFSQFAAAINVLKHGRGKSYETLLRDVESLPFRLKRPEENFFEEGDVSEIATLIEVNDDFVLGCAEVIRDVSIIVDRVSLGGGS